MESDPIEPDEQKPMDLNKASLAYVDSERRVVLYDTESQAKVWTAELTTTGGGAPAWSPDGEILSYVSWDPGAGKWRLALLEIDSGSETFLDIEGSEYYSFEIGATIEWSPSNRFLSIEWGGSELNRTVIMDLTTGRATLSYVGGPEHLWSADARKVAYVRLEGKYTETLCELVVLDISAGEEALVRGEAGYYIFPEAWTEQGAVIYRYVEIFGSERQKLDTDGGAYEYSEAQDDVPQPPGFPKDLGRLFYPSQNPNTGEWAVGVIQENDVSCIYRYMEGQSPSKIADGSHPVWRITEPAGTQ